MFECCNHLKAPYKGLGCFKELSVCMDEILKAQQDDSFMQKVENLHLQIKKHQSEIIKYFFITYFALESKPEEVHVDSMKLFMNDNLITIKTEFDPSSTGFVTKISFNEKPIEKIEREKKLLIEINRLEKHIANLKDELAAVNEY